MKLAYILKSTRNRVIIILILAFAQINLIHTWGEGACSKNRPAITPITLVEGADGDCTSSLTSDFESRNKDEETYSDCNYADTWGPYPKLEAKAVVPKNCESVKWQQNRVLETIKFFIGKGWNYCHHHTSYWLPPKNDDPKNTKNIQFRVTIDPDTLAVGGDKGVCSLAGFPNGDSSGDAGWKGLDCSHFTRWVYNFSFGAYLTTAIGSQACANNQPGVILNTKDLSKLLPGDILYIMGGGDSMKVTHTILWTGEKVNYTDTNSPYYKDTLLKNLGGSQCQILCLFLKRIQMQMFMLLLTAIMLDQTIDLFLVGIKPSFRTLEE